MEPKPAPERIKVEKPTETVRSGELTDSVYSVYVPQKLKIKGAQEHPAPLAQSAAMASVEPPDVSYSPAIPQEIITSGKLSIAQLEPIIYAGQAHERILPSGERQGFLTGDGTGVGKGRIIAGLILDNFKQGRTRAVWVTKNNPLLSDARRDWVDLGGKEEDIVDLSKIKPGQPIPQEENTVLFVTYGLLSQGLEASRDGRVVKKKPKAGVKERQSRLDQVLEWLGEDFDGVIAFDESHMMQNSLPIKGNRGAKKPSTQAIAGVTLQSKTPKSRVFYASATAATEVHNLAYADRLGLWGEGTPFENKLGFVEKIQAGGLAAMELVARDMKAMGVYIARNISFDGVEYSSIEHKLTPSQREIYDTASEGWQVVLANMNEALAVTGQDTGAQRGQANSKFWGALQRFFNQVITSMQMPTIIKEARAALDRGESVVFQLVNTNEATQNRRLAEADESDDDFDLDDLDLTPRDILMQYVEKSFPVQQHEEYEDDRGVLRSRPVLDSEGNIVLNSEAVAMRDKLLVRLGALSVPSGALEIILNELGAKNVAEITGRTQRVVRVEDEFGGEKAVLENRSPGILESEAKDFMDDKRRILVFSEAGGTGRSYHADKRSKNQRKRMHFLVQPGWRAEVAVQGFGRTHRTNQKQPPQYVLVTTDLSGQKRFISSIARRLDQLGALTKGQRQTGGQGLFGEKDNLEGAMARTALRAFYNDLVRDIYEGLPGRITLQKMGLDRALLDEYGNLKETDDLHNVPRFLNRVLALDYETQNKVFDAFATKLEVLTEMAIANGTIDTGMENYTANGGITMASEKVVYKDKITGAKTKIVELDAKKGIVPRPFSDVKGMDFYINSRSGRLWAMQRLAKNETLADGRVVDVYKMHGQDANITRNIDSWAINSGYEKVDADKAEDLWKAELKALPDWRTEKLILITGTLLPIWDKLPSSRVRVLRAALDDGTILLGRALSARDAETVEHMLGVQREAVKHTPESVREALSKGSTVILDNGWKFAPRKVNFENRIEITGSYVSQWRAGLTHWGAIVERIRYDTRYFIPDGPVGDELIAKVIDKWPVKRIEMPGAGAVAGASSDAEFDSFTQTFSQGGSGQQATDRAEALAREIEDIPERTVSKRAIIQAFSRFFGVPVRYGGFRKKDVLGIYKIKPEIIRVKMRHASDLRVLTHELGHHLDKMFDFSGSTMYQHEFEAIPYVAELMRGDPNIAEEKIRKEGVAEFIRYYLVDPLAAQSYAPTFYEYFEDVLAGVPDIQDFLKDMRAMIRQYSAQSSREKIAAFHDPEVPRRRSFREVMASAYSAVVNERAAVTMFVDAVTGGHIDPKRHPEYLMKLADGSHGRAHMFITQGQYVATDSPDRPWKKVGPSLNEIQAPISAMGEEVLEDFTYYWVAKRAQELDNNGVQSGLDKEVYEDFIEEIENGELAGFFAERLVKVIEFTRFNLDQLHSAGLLSDEIMDDIEKNHQFYAPFYRIRDDRPSGGRGYSGASTMNQGRGIKRIKGADLPIANVWESLVKQTYAFTSMAARNRAALALVDVSKDFEGTGFYFDKVANPVEYVRPFNLSLEDFAQTVMGALGVYSDKLLQQLEEMDYEKLVGKLFQNTGLGNAGKNLATVWRSGKPEFYEFADRELFEAMLHLSGEQTTAFGKIARKAANVMRVGHTVNAAFALRNFWRDQFASGIFSDNNYRPFIDGIRGAIQILGKGEYWEQWMLSGGAMATFDSYDADYMGKSLKGMVRKTMLQRIGTAVNPLTYLQIIPSISEYATNIGEFMRAMESGKGWVAAAVASRDITVDHRRHGSKTQAPRDAIPFFNSTIQGHDKLFRALGAGPGSKKEGDKSRLGRTILRALMYITLPTIGLYLMNRNNKWYHELPPWRKDLFWNFPVGPEGKDFIMLPKPFLPGFIFGTMVERYLTYADLQDKKAFDGWAKQMRGIATPNLSIWPIELMYELKANKNFFTGAPIVPQRELHLPADSQYGPYTSETAKAAGRVLGVAPRAIDHSINKVTGILGKTVVAGLDALLPPDATRAAPHWTDLPVLGDFFVTSRAGGSASIDTFYQDYNKARELRAAKDMGRSLDPSEQRYVDNWAIFSKVYSELGKMRAAEREIHKMEGVTAEHKRYALDNLSLMQVNLVRVAYGKDPILR